MVIMFQVYDVSILCGRILLLSCRYVLTRRWMRNDPDVDVEHLPGTVSYCLIRSMLIADCPGY
jgi:hypothetical protein